ncbi:hypothetical protein ABZX82_18945 [Streptomyces griseoflavus]|uniref:hypothetical protein n=1 Tax=Streptomyces griseoflavus TaxID=35619 RepID=UPI0033A42DAD
MGSDRNRDGTRSAGRVCCSCRQPVDTVVHRHKTFGINVPRWTAGPCHNPDCEHYVPEYVPAHPPRAVRAEAGHRRAPTGPPA